VGARRPRALGLLPFALVAALLALGWAVQRRGLLAPRFARAAAGREVPPMSTFFVDPSALVGDDWGNTTDPRWGDELRYELSKLPPFRVDDALAAGRLRETLESLSFVAAVEELSITHERVAIELRLREPVACVPVRSSFQMVDAEGVLISGLWPSPTRWEGAPLPVLGPLADADGAFANARPGDWLSEPEHLDALDVAVSLQEHLDVAERRALGRVVIDARTARRVTLEEPGIRLELEGRRLILFGRAPSANEPGELPEARKWDSVVRALRAEQSADESDRAGLAWDLIDVRWDTPDIVLRHPRVARAESPGPAVRHRSPEPARPPVSAAPSARPRAEQRARVR